MAVLIAPLVNGYKPYVYLTETYVSLATQLRASIYRVLNEALATGKPVEIGTQGKAYDSNPLSVRPNSDAYLATR